MAIRSNLPDADIYVNEAYVGRGSGVTTFEKSSSSMITVRKDGCQAAMVPSAGARGIGGGAPDPRRVSDQYRTRFGSAAYSSRSFAACSARTCACGTARVAIGFASSS